jgi:hypothetical protein
LDGGEERLFSLMDAYQRKLAASWKSGHRYFEGFGTVGWSKSWRTVKSIQIIHGLDLIPRGFEGTFNFVCFSLSL